MKHERRVAFCVLLEYGVLGLACVLGGTFRSFGELFFGDGHCFSATGPGSSTRTIPEPGPSNAEHNATEVRGFIRLDPVVLHQDLEEVRYGNTATAQPTETFKGFSRL